MCYCGNKHEKKHDDLYDYRTIDEMHKYENLKAQFQQEQVIKRNDALDSLIYATTARGNGKSNWFYDKLKEMCENSDSKIHVVRQNGGTFTELEKREIKERLNMIFGKDSRYDIDVLGLRFYIKDVIFNDPATIVFWSDGTKTVVKAHNEEFDPEKGLAMAICKKILGNKGNFNNLFKKWIPEEEKTEVVDHCGNCMHTYCDPEDEPCNICKDRDMWVGRNENVPEESESKEYLEIGKAVHEGIQAGLYPKTELVNKHYTVKMLAKKEGVSESTIRRRIATGYYHRAFKQDGAWIIPIKELKK
jgi:hypothetical protein